MRAASVAGGLSWEGVLDDVGTTIGALVAAALGAAGLWLANRLLGKAAFQTAISSGFKELTASLQEDNRVLREELATKDVAHAREVAALRGEIAQLGQKLESFSNELRRRGVDVARLTPAPEDPTEHIIAVPPSKPKKRP